MHYLLIFCLFVSTPHTLYLRAVINRFLEQQAVIANLVMEDVEQRVLASVSMVLETFRQ
jgi:hypothetical protein